MGINFSTSSRPPNQISLAAMVDHLMQVRAAGEDWPVIVAFCFSDALALKACFEACQETQSIPVIMVTLNQVNCDGGYAALTAAQFVGKAKKLAAEAGYDGPVVFGRDHGGPYIVEAHKEWKRPEAMAWVRQNITADFEAGFTCWHADGTSGRDDELESGKLPVQIIAAATVDLLGFCEKERKRLGLGPVAYEVGSEEQQGGLTEPAAFDQYLSQLSSGLTAEGLDEARIDFIVAQTGTHMKLHYEEQDRAFRLVQNGFQPQQVDALNKIAEKYRSKNFKFLFTQHYSDHITAADAEALRCFGAGKANFGPEMTMPELEFLLKWETAEKTRFARSGQISRASCFREIMLQRLDQRPDFWHKFLPADRSLSDSDARPSIFSLPPAVQDALIVFRGRYVKSLPDCREALDRLLENTAYLGIQENPAGVIVDHIKRRRIRPRLSQFNMIGWQGKIFP